MTGFRAAPTQLGASTKRSPRAARLALLFVPLLAILTAAPVDADAVATVLPPDGLHLRAAPGTEHVSLAVIPGGTRLPLLGVANDSGWYPVLYRSQRGWVRGDFLEVTPDAGATVRGATVRATGGLVLRKEPHRGADVLTTLPNGAIATVSTRSTSEGWLLAAFNGQTGWASAEFLQINGAPAPPPAPALPVLAAPPALVAPVAPTVTPPSGGGVRATITYYHPALEGGGMACGGRYRAEDPTIAAATSWPCGTKLRVCRNSNCVVVTVQDTGHMGPNWVDLSASAFRQLAPLPDAMLTGTVEVVP